MALGVKIQNQRGAMISFLLLLRVIKCFEKWCLISNDVIQNSENFNHNNIFSSLIAKTI